MRKNKISEAIGNINEKYVNEAALYTGEAKAVYRNRWLKWGSIAACLICVFAIGLTMILSRSDGGSLGIIMEDREPILVSIEKWQDEGFRCKVIYPDIHNFLREGWELLIQFESETKVTTVDGKEFIYDEQNPNAEDCGLPIGTIVQVYFKSVEYNDGGMADRIYAREIIPQE